MLRKPTRIVKMTLIQEAKPILGIEEDAAPEAVRAVQVLIPDSPQCMVWLDNPGPAALGPNRTYDQPVLPPGARVKFRIGARQRLFGACREGIAQGAIVVEYLS